MTKCSHSWDSGCMYDEDGDHAATFKYCCLCFNTEEEIKLKNKIKELEEKKEKYRWRSVDDQLPKKYEERDKLEKKVNDQARSIRELKKKIYDLCERAYYESQYEFGDSFDDFKRYVIDEELKND